MSRQLNISNTLLSLRDRMVISDAADNPIYEAAGDFSLIRTTWRIYKEKQQLALIKRKIFAWMPTWLITGNIGSFRIRKKFFAFTRSYKIIGGTFDGAVIRGSLWGFEFEIKHGGRVIAKTHEKIFTLRDTYSIEVIADNTVEELLTVIAIVTLRLDKKEEQKALEREEKDKKAQA